MSNSAGVQFFRVRTEARARVSAKSGRAGEAAFAHNRSQFAPLVLDMGDLLQFPGVSAH